MRTGIHSTNEKHPPRKTIAVDLLGKQDVHELAIDRVLGTVYLVDKDDDGFNYSR